jgi:hypothetical protein
MGLQVRVERKLTFLGWGNGVRASQRKGSKAGDNLVLALTPFPN